MKAWMILYSCILLLAQLTAAEVTYPDRPKDSPHYLNLSDLDGMDLSGRFETKRASDAIDSDMAVVLLRTIPDTITVENYAAELFNRWKMGHRHNGRGVLFLFVQDQSTLKIEVSYDLEGYYPDGFIGSYQETARTYFNSNQFGDFVSTLVNGFVFRYKDRSYQPEFAQAPANPSQTYRSGGAGITRSNYFYERERKMQKLPELSEEEKQKYLASTDPKETVDRYLRSVENGVHYPFLDVLKRGSQYMRVEYLKSPEFYRREYREYQKAMPYQLFVIGNYAVARFKDGFRTFPILLQRQPGGKWRIDMTKGWALVDGSLQSYEMDRLDHPWSFAFIDIDYDVEKEPAPYLIQPDQDLNAEIQRLEQRISQTPRDADAYFELGNLLYWECYWIKSAIDLIEQGLELNPDNEPYRWAAIMMRYRYPLMDGVEAHYVYMLKQDPNNRKALWAYSWFAREILRDTKKADALRKRYDDAKR